MPAQNKTVSLLYNNMVLELSTLYTCNASHGHFVPLNIIHTASKLLFLHKITEKKQEKMNILFLKFHRQDCMEGSRVNPGAFIFL